MAKGRTTDDNSTLVCFIKLNCRFYVNEIELSFYFESFLKLLLLKKIVACFLQRKIKYTSIQKKSVQVVSTILARLPYRKPIF
jgi:hypothetical protein